MEGEEERPPGRGEFSLRPDRVQINEDDGDGRQRLARTHRMRRAN